MERSVDVGEILAFINAYDIQTEGRSSEFCLGKLTEEIDETFLMNRAEEIREAY